MNPNVQPAGNPEPQGPMNVQGLAQSVVNAGNDPAIATAQANANTAQANANQSQQADYTLPQLLQSALIPTLTKTASGGTDPDVAKSTTDLATYLTDLKDPQSISDSAAGNVPGAVLSPDQQRSIIAGRLGSEAANLSQDNLIAGMRSGGIANIIKNLSMQHQQQTQQFMNAAALAKQIADQAITKAQLHADLAGKAADLLNSSRSLDLQEKGLGIQQQGIGIQQQQIKQGYALSPVYQQQQAQTKALGDAKKMSKTDFYNAWVGSPFLSATQASAIWNAAHPNQPVNFGVQGTANAASGGITSIQQLLPDLSSLTGGGSAQKNNNRPPLSSFDK